jgi:Plasmid pRiA4b ORF-3-like protein
MPRRKQPEQRFPITLTLAQRKAIAEIAPRLTARLKLDEPNQRVIECTPAELKAIKDRAQTAIQHARTGIQRRPLRHVLDSASLALDQSRGSASIPAPLRVYEFKITLLDSHPPIWRRIQVKDGTLDKLHEHIQTAMGWTNSHLHHFRVGNQRYGDPDLMQENFEDLDYRDSTTTKISDLLPRGGQRFRIQYEYDFGDSWHHEVHFEGIVRAEARRKYPRCLEGARACPPEDVGGVWGYADFVEAIRSPEHEDHERMLEWVGGSFDPEAFDPVKATREMRRGLPNWREWL